MKNIRKIEISYWEVSSVEELEEPDRELALRAIASTCCSYAPYSEFHVGAAVRMSGGGIAVGGNQENAAFPSGICAEKVALSSAFSIFPQESVRAVAIAAKSGGELTPSPLTPCGSCRDVLSESQRRSGEKIRVICVGAHAVWVVDGVENLLPLGFQLT